MDKKNNAPTVSIGMPIYNEADYLAETLDSLLCQTFYDFEIIISDNASTDDTSLICRKYAEKDKRIKYYREDKNIGEINNFNKVARLSKGKYFMWAAGHDLWNENYIQKCFSILESNPSVSVCFSFKNSINKDGNIIKIDETELDTQNQGQFLRFVKSLWILHDGILYGLIRKNDLDKTRLERFVIGPDHVLRSELALQGNFAQIKEAIFSLRDKRSENRKMALYRRLTVWHKINPLPWVYRHFPHWGMIWEFGKGSCYAMRNFKNRFFYFLAALIIGSIRFGKLLILDLFNFPFSFKNKIIF